MIVLSVDTSTQNACAAVMSHEGLIAEYTISNKKTHSQNIMPMIDDMLKKSDITMDMIDAFAVTVGPGSFTGLRIGMATVKTFSQVMKKPIVGVSTLEALAEGHILTDKLICPIIDARREDVYNALYKNGQCIQKDRAINIHTLLDEIKGQSVIFVGDGALAYRSIIEETMGEDAIFSPVCLNTTRGANVCQLALKKLDMGLCDDPYTLNPVYLRVSQAEREYAEKNKQ
ncbi:MAG: tRNA (adenosine(37)-N6)-threonylcarbamoyltransferase complex dimerization subunit type 1 TsaB [Ruminococcaceae bacterium]|nr:tRNA (adenosine(37)-N6)-threonylcarbamoyltransferase complex dimerization subunit type 1 TsaB [Oscillospiraceae bacterium]